MGHKFKVGDDVICRDPFTILPGVLSKGAKYTVLGLSGGPLRERIVIVGDDGRRHEAYERRFKLHKTGRHTPSDAGYEEYQEIMELQDLIGE